MEDISLAKQIEGVYEAILACAKREFLEMGYKDACLRTIAREANTSTGSIYTRLRDKEGLFKAVVEPAVQEMRRMFLQIQERFHSFDEQTQRDEMGRYTVRHQMERSTISMTTSTNSACCSAARMGRTLSTFLTIWWILRSNTPTSTWK